MECAFDTVENDKVEDQVGYFYDLMGVKIKKVNQLQLVFVDNCIFS